ncbi:hypothetical protein [Streptomyces erythrochromogenes]|uniref:hypothetical protein n=1 Tax=Streptomyces erythrochromogenes TaxID=285574 RepID=UPI003449D501
MSGVLRVRHAAGRLRAAMEQGLITPEDLAQALEDCGLLQSPETVRVGARVVRPATLVERHIVASGVGGDSPAAALARRLRESQPDVIGTNVLTASDVQVTVRPQSGDCLLWWLGRFKADPETGTDQGGNVYAVRGHHEDVTVHLVIIGDAVAAWDGTVRRAS